MIICGTDIRRQVPYFCRQLAAKVIPKGANTTQKPPRGKLTKPRLTGIYKQTQNRPKRLCLLHTLYAAVE